MRSPPALLFLAVLPLMGASTCGPDLIENAGFDLWCGDQLCNWEVEEGEVARVPTWHERDTGAELIGPRVAISQLSEATQAEVACIHFSLIANAEPGADLELQMDFLDDGVVEYTAPVPATNWEEVSFHVTPPTWFEGLRFRIVKTGEASAVIAQVRAQTEPAEDCTAEPLELTNRPDGGECTQSDSCAGGSCEEVPVLSSGGDGYLEQTCGGCARDADCGEGESCGLAWGDGLYGYRDCLPDGEKALGVACASGDECGSGTCCEGQCSECCGAMGCAEGESCARHPAEADQAPEAIQPFTCDPASGARESGAPCLQDEDCASAACVSEEGTTSICDPDGRPCETVDDCPWSVLGGTCLVVGQANGSCR